MRGAAPDRGSARILLAAVAFLPGIVLAVVLLIQGSKLDLPPAGRSPGPVRALTQLASVGSSRVSLERSARSTALEVGWIGVAVLLVAGGVLALLLAQRLRQPAAAAGPPPAGEDGSIARDRELLIGACIELADVIPSDSLRSRLRDALTGAGVEPVLPEKGAEFDAASYRVVDRVATDDPALHNRIATIERAGYVDRGRRLRPPEVLVYVLEDRSHA